MARRLKSAGLIDASAIQIKMHLRADGSSRSLCGGWANKLTIIIIMFIIIIIITVLVMRAAVMSPVLSSNAHHVSLLMKPQIQALKTQSFEGYQLIVYFNTSTRF